MTTIINASATNGLQQTADGSGILKVQSNGVTTNALAWVNFTGSTATVNAAYNISSVTRTSVGNYTLNFTNNMQNANYVWSVSYQLPATSANNIISLAAASGGVSTSALSLACLRQTPSSGTLVDTDYLMTVVIHGN